MFTPNFGADLEDEVGEGGDGCRIISTTHPPCVEICVLRIIVLRLSFPISTNILAVAKTHHGTSCHTKEEKDQRALSWNPADTYWPSNF